MKKLFAIALISTLSACATGGGMSSGPEKQRTIALGETYWKVTEVLGQPVQEGMREPNIMIRKEHEFSGSGGCNEMGGKVELQKDNHLKFSQVISTMMACPKGMEGDKQLSQALEIADSYSLSGNKLQFNDAGGIAVVKFEAVNLP